MSCCKCGVPSDPRATVTLTCGHTVCVPCDGIITARQQKHTGRTMHDNAITCPAPGCTHLYFTTTNFDGVPEEHILFFYPIPSEPMANPFLGPFQDEQGLRWPSVEHYMQAKKVEGHELEEIIRNCATTEDAHLLGWGPGARDALRKDWDRVKLSYLRRAYGFKFSQVAPARERLAATGDRVLVQCDTDLFWGANMMSDSGRMQGRNVIGSILMEVREDLKSGQL